MKLKFSVMPVLCWVLALALAGCGGVKPSGDTETVYSPRALSVDEYYNLGVKQINRKDLTTAVSTLEDMEVMHPLSFKTGALNVKLMQGFYDAGQPDQVKYYADKFTSMFPGHGDTVQAHYLAAMVDYEWARENISMMDASKSNPDFAKAARARFNELLKCCDNNNYAFQSRQYLEYLNGMLALYELRDFEQDYDAGRIDEAADKGIHLLLTYPDSVAADRVIIMLASKLFDEHRARIELATAVTLPDAEEPIEVVTTKSAFGAYAVFLAKSTDPAELKLKVEAMGLAGEVDYYKTNDSDEIDYFAAYGQFNRKSEAETTLVELSVRTDNPDLLVRKIENSQYVENIDIEKPVETAVVAFENAVSTIIAPLVVPEPEVVAVIEPKAKPVEKIFTIQLMSYSTPSRLKKAMAGMGMPEGVALYSHEVKGKTYYIALYGNYTDWSAGKAALTELEKRTGKTDYWLRKIDSSKVKALD